MSESLFANLPRFDSGDLPAVLAQAPDPVVAEPELVQVDELEDTPEPAAQIDPNVEVLLNRLAQEIEQANKRVVAQTADWVSAIIERLFPELSKAFLAEEVVRQIPNLLPDTPNHAVLSAPAPLAEQLTEIIESNPRLSNSCIVQVSEDAELHDVQVSWETGGLSLEFDELLAACLERLQSYKTPQKDF